MVMAMSDNAVPLQFQALNGDTRATGTMLWADSTSFATNSGAK
jgi:hypothetical protein